MKSFLDGRVVLHSGDCADVIKTIPDNSIDAVCTDPPYALVSIVKRVAKTSTEDENDTGKRSKNGADGSARLARGFMGKEWDNGAVAFSVEFWTEVLRVLKPGAHVVAFGGTRTFHRLACAIEDAGFEVRDALMWHFATGFPKSHSVPLAIDKINGIPHRSKAFNLKGGGDRADEFAENGREQLSPYAPSTDAARQWEGWGSALKPATEIICLVRKPLSEPTIAANVLRWGCGAINVDACRIATGEPWKRDNKKGRAEMYDGWGMAPNVKVNTIGARWPANLCHDGSGEVRSLFSESGSGSGGATVKTRARNKGWCNSSPGEGIAAIDNYGDSGSAARFFYSAKANKSDRAGSKHPTIKPVALMRWLCRMVCPPGGTILDPFAGTGTTGEAAWREGFNAVLIEREAEYQADIARRMEHVRASDRERKEIIAKAKGQVDSAGPLFGEIECT